MKSRIAAFVLVPTVSLLAVGCGSSSSSSSSSGSAGATAYCAAAQTVKADSTALDGLGGSPTIDQVHRVIGKFTADVDAVDAVSVAAIANDWHTIRSTIDRANITVQASTTLAQAGQGLSALGATSLKAAGERIDAETQRQCGFTIGTPTPAPGSSTSGSSSTDTGSSSSSSDTGSSSSSSTDTGTSSSSTSS